MHLLFITTKNAWGGSEPLWVEAAKRAVTEGHKVTAVFPQGRQPHEEYTELERQGIVMLSRPDRMKPTLLQRIVWYINGIRKPEVEWWRRTFASEPDAICVSQGGTYCALSMPGLIPWLHESGIPYLSVCHSYRSYAVPGDEYRPELQRFFAGAGKVCFVAGAHAGQAAEFLGIELPNAVTVQNPLREAISEAPAWPADSTLRLACVGRLEIVDKGQDLLLEVLANPAWKNRDYTLDLFGSGPDEQMLAAQIAEYGLSGQVRLAGFEHNVHKIWETHQALVMPSRSEGTPTSLIEAQLCGRPAVVTAVDGNPDWVVDGETGFLAREATAQSFAEALEQAWENRHRLREMGEAARKECLAKRDPDPAGILLGLLRDAATVACSE